MPLAEARLSTFLAADKDNTDDAPDAFLSGAISDVQARYNLHNLIDRDGEHRPGRTRGAGAPVRERRRLGRRGDADRQRPARRCAAAPADAAASGAGDAAVPRPPIRR